MDQPDRVKYLLGRYLGNTCTREEMDELFDYIRQHPDNENLVDTLDGTWHSEPTANDSLESAWSDMQERMRQPVIEKDRQNRKLFWKIAACLLPVAACVAGLLHLRENPVPSLSETLLSNAKSIATADDEHRLVVLSDGSKVWISDNSKITSPKQFSDGTREVTLYGEAFFDIRHDPNRPFIITTGKVKTTVLGTAFNIRAFPEEGEVTVTVSRGKVYVEAENKEGGVITANQQITLDLPSKKLESGPADAATVSRWTEEDLILHEITLDEVEEMLEDRYSVDIRFDNSQLMKCRFTTTFFKHATLDEVLTSICLVNGASYRIEGSIITIYGEGCP